VACDGSSAAALRRTNPRGPVNAHDCWKPYRIGIAYMQVMCPGVVHGWPAARLLRAGTDGAEDT
jgi:hypothetical protein